MSRTAPFQGASCGVLLTQDPGLRLRLALGYFHSALTGHAA